MKILKDYLSKQIENSNDIDYLEELLKYINMDLNSLKDKTKHNMNAKIHGMTVDEYIKNKQIIVRDINKKR